MQRHIHMHVAATYFKIDGVEKIAYATWKRAPNQTLMAECIVVLKPSCGTLEISTSQREKLTEHKTTIAEYPLSVRHGEKVHYYAHKPYIFKINLF